MSTNTCRDCGSLLQDGLRGCPTCALNFEAEQMLDRVIWRRLMPGVLIVTALGAIALLYWLR